MTFSKAQERTAWCSLAVMAGMLLLPPWVWRDVNGTVLVGPGTPSYDWLWALPAHANVAGVTEWHATIWWPRLLGQWLVIAIGMLLLLFLREARDQAATAAVQGARWALCTSARAE